MRSSLPKSVSRSSSRLADEARPESARRGRAIPRVATRLPTGPQLAGTCDAQHGGNASAHPRGLLPASIRPGSRAPAGTRLA
jgi:hypothetical protein